MAFDMTHFRARLRAEREARVGGRDKLAEKVGVAKSTIQNAEMGPDIPGIDTVARLIEAMPGLTLSSFFAEIESRAPGHETGKARIGGSLIDRPVSPVSAPAVPGLYEELGRLVVRLAHDAAGEQAPGARVARPGGRKGHRKTR